jgi:hypothetical protein
MTLPDLQLTLTIERPSRDNPEGYICLTANELHSERGQDGSDGPHSTETLANCFADIASFYATGQKSKDPESFIGRIAKKFLRGPI